MVRAICTKIPIWLSGWRSRLMCAHRLYAVSYNYSPKCRWIVQGYTPGREASSGEYMALHYSPTLRWIIVLLYTFCCFSAPLLRLIKVFWSSVIANQNATPFCFSAEANSAMLFRDTQPIKLQKKHYSDFEYMLKWVYMHSVICTESNYRHNFEGMI